MILIQSPQNAHIMHAISQCKYNNQNRLARIYTQTNATTAAPTPIIAADPTTSTRDPALDVLPPDVDAPAAPPLDVGGFVGTAVRLVGIV